MRLPKREAALKATLIKELKKHRAYLVFTHSDRRLYGVPDLSISGHGMTSWWELKHATPYFYSSKIQELTCYHLSLRTACHYILYFEHDDKRYTQIVLPKNLHNEVIAQPEAHIQGHDQAAVVQYIKQLHGEHR